jgi:hypothetical protein
MSYARQIASAQRLIKKKGLLVTWRKLVRTQNNVQPWKGTTANQDFQVYIVFLRKGGNLASALQSLFKGTEITQGAPNGIMGSIPGLIPELTDVVIRNGVTLAISAIDPLAPDGTPILYFVEFK